MHALSFPTLTSALSSHQFYLSSLILVNRPCSATNTQLRNLTLFVILYQKTKTN